MNGLVFDLHDEVVQNLKLDLAEHVDHLFSDGHVFLGLVEEDHPHLVEEVLLDPADDLH